MGWMWMLGALAGCDPEGGGQTTGVPIVGPDTGARPPSTVAPPGTAPDPDTAGPRDTATEPVDSSVQQQCVDVINTYRATLSLPPYARWNKAEPCVDGQAQADSETGIAHSAFGVCEEWAQNVCPGWSGTYADVLDGCLAMMWAEGPGEPFSEHGHYINMSSTDYTEVACGFYTTPDGAIWEVQDFR